MTAKKLFMICLLLAGLFCLPAEAQHPGETVSPQTIRKLGEKHFFSLLRNAISRLAVASDNPVFSQSLSLLRFFSSENICKIIFCLSVKFIGSFIGSFNEPDATLF